jgi:hypothetical protein
MIMGDKMSLTNLCEICDTDHLGVFDTNNNCQDIRNRLKDKYGSKRIEKVLRNAEPRINKKKGEVEFKCYYTGIYSIFKHDAKGGFDPVKDAYFLTIDHRIPGDNDSLVISLHIINAMKQNIPGEKFERIVTILGKRFHGDMNQNEFEDEFYKIFE